MFLVYIYIGIYTLFWNQTVSLANKYRTRFAYSTSFSLFYNWAANSYSLIRILLNYSIALRELVLKWRLIHYISFSQYLKISILKKKDLMRITCIESSIYIYIYLSKKNLKNQSKIKTQYNNNRKQIFGL